MKINAQKFPETLLAIAISIALTSTATANNNITPPAGINDTVIINNNQSITLSTTDNTDPAWDNFRSLWVGDNSDGSLLIDGRDIATAAGMIGNGANGSVTLTNGATWTLDNLNLVLGTHDGSGTLLVSNGSKISGIDELRIGEYAANAQGTVTIDGANSSVSSVWSVVGDQGRGNLVITRGGSLSLSEHMNIGYVGNTSNTSRNGYGVTLVDGENSLLDVTEGIYLGGFATTPNDATGILTVSNGATVRSGNLIWLAVGEGSTGILNIGGAKGEAQQAAGTLDLPRIHLGNTGGMNTAELNFNHNSDDFALSAKITGTGEVNHVGSGTTTLTGANTYQGLTHVASGTLRAGVENTLSARSDYRVDSGAQLDLNGYSQILNSLELAGTAILSSPSQVKAAFIPTTMTINGDYTGNNGLLALRTVLGDDLSATDKLVVRGDTSGTTRVSVSNAGGNGAATTEGIRIIDVEGVSNGTFMKEGRIVAGAYDYDIVKRDNQNWSLTSIALPGPIPPTPPVEPKEPEVPTPPTPAGPHQYRPETGSYLANILAANTLFNTRLHDRLGETQYTDALTGEQKVTSLWMRHVGGHNRFKDGSGQISTQSNRYVMQLGGDIAQWSTDGLDRWHLGLMAGYANSKSRNHSSLTGYTSRGEISGYSAGLYGTWYANDADKTGAYIDGWMLYNWFDNTVSGQGLASEKYDSDGITASVETGYTWKLAEFSERNALYIQPKAQITWMDVQADTHVEKNGTRVVDKTDGNLQTRLGVKAYLQGHNAMDDGKDRTFQPFVEANWIHNTSSYSVKMDDISNDVKGNRNIGELKVGVEGQLNQRLQLWGNVAQQIGDNGYSDTQGMLGIKYSF
ncbi:autotransporter outer membrane beta-barrel domain-containing protein [Citrobacter amalonaticus]|uniref:autotransporter outer membrane beta-barrel domain-containing protein n=1 Tax=Citrobacter amalonaticus TaxID=35703 RepID=UPI00255A7B4D|nr:autotransporter outer membrane beta-barrel domain-containing protein [Citrobacter amalonaticus]MDL4617351.1 autotransporter outer membrane beta-barrel domain-containing protein [Citrobacter amalonaticus]MDL4621449.1 autotransporter outer membrane beta-barrel domain-containing protein [Citrobacter amalonaticus]